MIYGLETVIVGVYAPTDDSTLATKDTFCSQFSDVLTGIKPHQEILILGDINAIVGSRDDSKGKDGANCGSDHRLIAAKLVVSYRTSRSGTRTGLVPEEQGTSIRYRLDLLQQESIKHLPRRLDSALAEAPLSEDIEEEYSNIKLALKRAAHEALGYEQKRKIQKAPSIRRKNVITCGCQIKPTLTGKGTNPKTEKRVKPSKNRKPKPGSRSAKR
ncbi:hypothetical protein HHI36_011621 [Cryptolaemus montrouzieri]|uniref:Endonuclease/exonuclease/phosphatase domain-containing protein n=1 Tax=Cryptolaemus montrouzieri TaxID=559131 RepID=A0ABD2MM62_9CUCU